MNDVSATNSCGSFGLGSRPATTRDVKGRSPANATTLSGTLCSALSSPPNTNVYAATSFTPGKAAIRSVSGSPERC